MAVRAWALVFDQARGESKQKLATFFVVFLQFRNCCFYGCFFKGAKLLSTFHVSFGTQHNTRQDRSASQRACGRVHMAGIGRPRDPRDPSFVWFDLGNATIVE